MGPSIRASHAKSNLDNVERLGPGAAATVRARFGLERASLIADSSRVGWIPVEVDVALTELVAEVVGMDAMEQWSLDAIRQTVDGPLLRPFLDGAIRLFGLSPTRFFGLVPRAWNQIYRNCGKVQLTASEERRAVIVVAGAPAAMRKSEAYARGIAASIGIVYPLCRVFGRIESGADHASLRFVCEWHAADDEAGRAVGDAFVAEDGAEAEATVSPAEAEEDDDALRR